MGLRILSWGWAGAALLFSPGAAVAVEAVMAKPNSQQQIEIELLAKLDLDGGLHDLSGVTGSLEDGSPADQFGGLSAIEYSGTDNRFYLLADRGAGDGAVNYQCRFHEAELSIDPSTHKIVCELIATRMIATPDGKPIFGSTSADNEHLASLDPKHQWTALDPEGMRRLTDGSLLLSDEYGPHLIVTDAEGQMTREIPLPEKYRRRASQDGVDANRGVSNNRGLEGVAVTPSGNRVLAMPQSPLLQDSVPRGRYSLGLNCRCFLLDTQHNREREIVYRLDDVRNGLSEVLAIDEQRFLVIERDGKQGTEATHKRIYLAEIGDCSDVRDLESLPETNLPAGVRAMKKTLFIDFLDPQYGIPHESIKEKAEGLCWGPRLPDGRRTLWVCYDNDFESSNQTEIDCFAIAGLE